MTQAPRRPRLAVIVYNSIVGDSRVQKTALAAARDGWDVTLIGITKGRREEHGRLGPVKVLRVRVPARLPTAAPVPAPRPSGRTLVSPFGLPGGGTLSGYQWAHRMWVRERTVRLGFLSGPGAPTDLRSQAVRMADKVVLRGGNALYRARMQALQKLIPEPANGTADADSTPADELEGAAVWRTVLPGLQNLDLAFGEALDRLRPDVIHANDFNTIHIGARSAARLRARGHHCAWVYDAHEYVRGVHLSQPKHLAAYSALEDEFIGMADAVVTVTPEIAELLRRDHHLAELPGVVCNTPVRGAVEGDSYSGRSIREDCGLDEDTPLLAHVGSVAEKRDLPTAFAALQHLPGTHLAVVANMVRRTAQHFRTMASRMGVRDRVHFLPYVPQHQVPDYLSSADLGLFCGLHTVNHDLALATKLFEYMHARIPVVTSDVRAMDAFVRQHDIGRVFTAGDALELAEAVRSALSHRKEHIDNITEELLETYAWEHQSAGLVGLYRKLSGLSPATPEVLAAWTAEPVFEDEPATPAPQPSASAAQPVKPSGPTLEEAAIRVSIGPINSAGQCHALAGALRRHRPDVAARSSMLMTSDSFPFQADHRVDNARFGDLDLQTAELRRILGSFTHVIADGFKSVFAGLNGDTIEHDLPSLCRAGLRVALLAHGSEVRDPEADLLRNPESPYRAAPQDVLDILVPKSAANRATAARACENGIPVFVTTPDLLTDLPFATWLPLVVDVAACRSEEPVLQRKRPVVVHAPSRRWTKGTDEVLPVLTQLNEEGAIELRLLENLAPWEVLDEVRRADIVADQFAIGGYGVLACEAMAAGRPVLAYLNDAAVHRIGEEVPLVNTTADTLREAIESLLDDREAGAELGRRASAFAQDHHDGRRSVEVLGDFLTRS